MGSPLVVKSGSIHFDSKTPLESFGGGGKNLSGYIDLEKKEIKITVDLTVWRTEGKLRTAHMHENYLETDKFPESVFIGKLTEYDNKTGKAVTIGTFNLHGVELPGFRITGTLLKIDKGYRLQSDFTVKLTDFKIPVPELLTMKVNNEISIKADMILDGN